MALNKSNHAENSPTQNRARGNIFSNRQERVLLEQRHIVYRLALRLTGGCQAEAEDVTQEALIAGLTHLPFFLGKSRVTTWLYTITVRTWRTRQKRQYQEMPLPETELAGHDEWNGHLARFDLDRAVRTLPQDMRDAFVLVKAEGLSHKEAAHILGVPLGTVLWRVREACLRLRPLLQDETSNPPILTKVSNIDEPKQRKHS